MDERKRLRDQSVESTDDDRITEAGQRKTRGLARKFGLLPTRATTAADDNHDSDDNHVEDDEDDEFELPPQLRPWAPTPELPKLPLHWLWESADSAWQLQRQSQLFSKAPIPPLLHVCNESRTVLRAAGYDLSFRTPARHHIKRAAGDGSDGVSTPGMIWFNFRYDTLYIGHAGHDYEESRTVPSHIGASQPWDLAPFLPSDLRRVERIMLPHSSQTIAFTEWGGANFPYTATEAEFDSWQPVFPALRHLFLAEWALLGGCLACNDKHGHVKTHRAHGPDL